MPWPRWLRRPALTVAIPLHRAAPWFDVVCANVERIPAGAAIVISDRSGRDDTLHRLRKALAGDRRIVFRRASDGANWRLHVNALIEACRSPFFSILPQDDDIRPGYYESLVAALERESSAGIAFGTVRTVGLSAAGEEGVLAGPPLALGRRDAWREAIDLDRSWNLGIPWRGVIRRRCLAPMLPTPQDRFADQIWVFGIALVSHLVEVPGAEYVKRYHEGNTHGGWTLLSASERRAAQLAEIERRFADRPHLRDSVANALEEGPETNGTDRLEPESVTRGL